MEQASGRLAARQQGVLHRDQARALGLTDSSWEWLTRSGRWPRLLPGVLASTLVPDSLAQRVQATALWSPAGGPICCHAAARAHGLPVPPNEEVHLLTHRWIRAPVAWVVPHLTGPFDPQLELCFQDRILMTSPARTLLDLAGHLSTEALERCLDAALAKRLTRLDTVEAMLRLRGGRGRKGQCHLRSLLEARGRMAAAESEFEFRFRAFLRELVLPMPQFQASLTVGESRVLRVDALYPSARLVVELDGRAFHTSRADWEQDRERDALLAAHGFRVLRITWDRFTQRREEVARQLCQALGADLSAESRA